jgi:uridine kinase
MKPKDPNITLIGICGGSASGKSLLAKNLAKHFHNEDEIILSLDHFYWGETDVAPSLKGNFDHPLSIDETSFSNCIAALKEGKPTSVPNYDFKSHSRTGLTVFKPNKVIIVEGVLLFSLIKAFPLFDITIFVESDSDIRLARRIERDTIQRGRTLQSVLDQYFDTVRPMHEKFVQPFKKQADIIISGNDDPHKVLGNTLEKLKPLGL